MTTARRRANYRQLLRDGSFLRFFIGQVFSSYGDWVGLLAILALVKRIYDNEFAVAVVLFARMAPALFFGPVAGVLADRWNRKKTMVFCDVTRAGLIATLPFIETVSARIPLLSPVVLLFIVSALLEILTLLWQPSKDASVPDMVRDRTQYTHAYSLLLIAAYVTFPLAGATIGVLANASSAVASAFGLSEFALNREHLAFFFDSFTFVLSAVLTLSLRIPPRPKSKRKLDLGVAWEELIDGLRFIRGHTMIRPWVTGIAGTFAGIGIFLSMALFFVSDVLGGGQATFGFLVTAVGIGLGLGFVLAGPVALAVPKDVLFSSAVIAMGGCLIGFSSVSTLSAAVVATSLSGFFAGIAYPTGFALVQERLGEGLRGRTSASINSVIRLALVGASATAPVVVRLVDSLITEPLVFGGQSIDLRGVRVAIWAGGLLIFASGLVTTRAVRARWRGSSTAPGIFLVLEGGDRSGKTTQIEKLRAVLESRGHTVCVTREPGGTQVGNRVRELLLDPMNAISPKTEALLYAADRAQHVEEVIKPALARGEVVVSDRYLDSSVAYQGLARGLGLERIRDLNQWGTEGLLPDLVILLDLHPAGRGARDGEDDRLEREDVSFHTRVREAYLTLAERNSDRFLVIDAARTVEEVADEIIRRVTTLMEESRS